MLSLLFLTAFAQAGQREIGFSVGTLNSDDPNWDMFAGGDMLPSYGVRVAYPLVRHLKLVGGYEYGETGSSIWVTDSEGDDGQNGGFQTGFYGNQILLGVKGHFSPSRWVTLYGVAQGDLLAATVRIDDDPDDDANPGQVERGGVSGGFIVALGAGVTVPTSPEGPAWEAHIEAGYGWIAPLVIEDVGRLEFSGVSIRAGTGIIF